MYDEAVEIISSMLKADFLDLGDPTILRALIRQGDVWTTDDGWDLEETGIAGDLWRGEQ